MIKNDLRREWMNIEHGLRYIAYQEEDMSPKDWFEIDSLKSAIIALCGFKLFDDDNETFYENMKQQVKDSLKYLRTRFVNCESDFLEIEYFLSENL
jgi:hypothetical protein